MKNSSSSLGAEAVAELQKRLTKLQVKSQTSRKGAISDEFISVKLGKANSRFGKRDNPDPTAKDIGVGKFFLSIDITAIQSTVYIPISIASGKKTVGFIYQIEGTAAGEINTTDISCHGDGVTKITLGTLLYAKIPAGKTGGFKISIEIIGGLKKEYKITINQISYKLDPADARYQKLPLELGTKWLKFS